MRTGDTALTGWLDTKGELRLFTSQAAMIAQSKYPHCVSGVMRENATQHWRALRVRRVRVQGTAYDFNTLPLEIEGYPLARHVLGGAIITNWCFGPRVILVDRIELADR